jgi:hypothetical protein
MALEEAEIVGLTDGYCSEALDYVTGGQGLVQRAQES